MTAEDSDDDMEDMAEEGIPMQGEDGQHYVVLEVWKGYLIVLNYNFQVRCLEGLYSSSWPQAFLCKQISWIYSSVYITENDNHVQVIQLPEQSGEQGVVQIGPGPSGLQPPATRCASSRI